MHEKFQMSSMGELTFFLGVQVQQKKDDIFISQDKYIDEILKKFGFIEVKTASTPMETQKPLLKDEDGEEVDVHIYVSTAQELQREMLRVNAASKEVSTAELVSTAYLKEFDLLKWDQQVVSDLEVIENGATLPKTLVAEGVTIVMPIKSAKDKTQRRLEVKARSTLMMGIPNEHQLKFNSIKDAKLLL
ncbi:uncharacterized mitochondrial protein-like protein, partial [Tanacetum coccineum]